MANEFKDILFKELNGTRELRIKGIKINDSDIVICNYFPNDSLKSNPMAIPFRNGLTYKVVDLYTWAQSSKFQLFENGLDSQKPFIISLGLNAGKTVLTITFPDKINKTSDATALKAAITIATNGTTFVALGGSDSVGTVDGTGTTIVITFNAALSGSTNKIAIAAGAIKDSSNNLNEAIVTNSIDVTAPTVTFSPANSATGVTVDVVPMLTFSEAITMPDGSEILTSDLLTLITLKLTNSGGADVPFTARVSDDKKKIFVIPTLNLKPSQAYYIAIGAGAVIDYSGNGVAASNATFTTGA